LKNSHEIWSNQSIFASGGMAFETYQKDFEVHSWKPIAIIDTNLASKGLFPPLGKFVYKVKSPQLSSRASIFIAKRH
tara:strand:+ start:22874 stop:23104 length:231 start_codon:yes stop_codon:yes gene_type:complete